MIREQETTVRFHVWGSPGLSEERVRLIRLDNDGMTYAMAVTEEGYLLHVYYGKRCGEDDLTYLLHLEEGNYVPRHHKREKGGFMDSRPFEYPCHGIGDYREPCFMILDGDGMSSCDLRYKSHRIVQGKPPLTEKGVSVIPATFAGSEEAETLIVTMEDSHAGLLVELNYSIFRNLNVMTRSAKVYNRGYRDTRVQRVLSACVEFPSDRYDMVTLNGSWARERGVCRAPLHGGVQAVDSRRGISSAQHNPFAAICAKNADEDHGEVFGFNLVYSGNFLAETEVNDKRQARFVMGINPYDFSWLLKPEEEFTAPEAVMVYSEEGFGGMSRTFHDLYRNHLIRGYWKDRERPVLINNWEATYFNFDQDKLYAIAEQASKLGIEMLVMDDGWFGHRDFDDSSLGDWHVYEKKLAGGLKPLVDRVNALGMKFGIWFEPEMVSENSELYRAHPEWAIQIIGRELTQMRAQYVLDYSNAEVRDYVYGMLRNILDSANIEYVKWDMNRALTEVGSTTLPAKRQRELWHRYVLGVYDLMNRFTTDYPKLLLENCSSGGGRFDPAMLYFSPQIWTSDDTDAIERLKIQYGTSFCYPASAMGAHVSDCPNHLVGRTVPFETRGDVALVGTFGYELDVTRISEEDRNQIPGQVERFHRFNPLIREGDHYRIGNPFESSEYDAWAFVSKDKNEALFTFVRILGAANMPPVNVKLKGLDPKKRYLCEQTGQVLSGSTLMNCGLNIGTRGDFISKQYYFRVTEEA
ncbi:MAG: alpha-galactosidase [Lachnospiraceae bacterium]|nr:alpha-galactosidase [Lachnospiraceae bacterium]